MRKLSVFNNVSLDGYFVDGSGDMSWAHKQDAEWNAFSAENARGGGALVLGRVTYEMMAGFWPTPAALALSPAVAERMNNMPKVVFSRTLETASWKNTRLMKGDLVSEMRKLKAEPGPEMTILGSGSIVAQLAEAGLVDDYQLVLQPIVLGSGRTLFQGVQRRLGLTLEKTRSFSNGNVVLWYKPAA
ncbi:dihydrofolate reductase family protein [Pyxidicoccus xibeiensis]|uniref:dihydrofolate reductase family protein n=1 Tax=Pyxidicoccus xibeiensis TaxID=2906759 RepID=UPI0020A74EB5|nr:dihydrofolate reductase family protein [Pyxidicoccus xibeiensis]MCP3140833.1 dihydrofolate reductase family protein [Pyxidicoccus xibeiensis]